MPESYPIQFPPEAKLEKCLHNLDGKSYLKMDAIRKKETYEKLFSKGKRLDEGQYWFKLVSTRGKEKRISCGVALGQLVNELYWEPCEDYLGNPIDSNLLKEAEKFLVNPRAAHNTRRKTEVKKEEKP